MNTTERLKAVIRAMEADTGVHWTYIRLLTALANEVADFEAFANRLTGDACEEEHRKHVATTRAAAIAASPNVARFRRQA